MQVKALLFDLGRVVIDIDFDRVIASWSRAAGCDAEALAHRFETQVRGAAAFGQHERAEIADAAFCGSLRRGLAIELDDAALLQGWNDVFVGEMPGVAGLLRSAAEQFPIYALSNTNVPHHATFSVRFADVLAPFRKLYLSHEMGLRKPEPAIYEAVARDIGLAPPEILFFDDLNENVAAAREVGLQAVLVRSLGDMEAAIAACSAERNDG